MQSTKSEQLPYLNKDLPYHDRAVDLMSRMTLEEKLAQLGSAWVFELCEKPGEVSLPKAQALIGEGLGSLTRPGGSTPYTPEQTAQANNSVQEFLRSHTRLGIPALVHEECLSGLMASKATVFPQIIGLSSSWNPDLLESVGKVIRSQIRATGGHHGLAPVLDITRDPRWGRVEETFGEDKYLTASMGCAYVRGVQGQDLTAGVVATGKHFAAHGMPESGLNWAPVHLGERELREVHLFPFEAAVREAGLGTLMITYHELDGIPVAASGWLMEEILRNEWGFEGIVISDYNAIVMLADYHHTAADKRDAARQALIAGVDLELPKTDCYGAPILELFHEGSLDRKFLDRAVYRILLLKFKLGLFENPFVNASEASAAFNRRENADLAHQAATQSMVLLKNDDHLLPLSRQLKSIAVIGPNANTLRRLLGDYTYGSFAELMSGGATDPVVGGHEDSQPVSFPESLPKGMITIFEAVRSKVSQGADVQYQPGCGFSDLSQDGIPDAVALAQNADVAILVMGGKSGLTQDCTTGELRDAASLSLPGVQEQLIEAVLDTGTPVVLVLVGGRPAAIPDLVERIPAVLNAWLPGEKGAEAVADVLFGDANPGGKLPITFPRSVGQIPIFYSRKPSGGQSYNFIDYVDELVKPLFPFGHGLSYSEFVYSDFRVKAVADLDAPKDPKTFPMETTLEVSLKIKNVGEHQGAEVVQLYVRDMLGSVTRPVQELKGFQRLELLPGESRSVCFELPAALLAFYDTHMHYLVEPGEFEIMVGSSSQDIRHREKIWLSGDVLQVSRKQFFGRSYIS